MCTDLQVIMHKRKTNSTTTQPHNHTTHTTTQQNILNISP